MKTFSITIPYNRQLDTKLIALYGMYKSRVNKQEYCFPVFHLETVYKLVYPIFPALITPLLTSPRYKQVRNYYQHLLSNARNSARTASNFDFNYTDDMTPMDYQKSGVELIYERFLQGFNGAILSDEPGTGKTSQAIWAYHTIKNYEIENYNQSQLIIENVEKKYLTRCLVICPNSVKGHWKDEWSKCASRLNPQVNILGADSNLTDLGAEISIVNFDLLWKHRKMLRQKQFDFIILDEGHNFVNTTSKRGQVMKSLAEKCQFFLCLSGTPIKNYVFQLRTLLQFIDPNSIWDNKELYEKTFCDLKRGKYGKDRTGYSNLRMLKRILNMHYMIRRTKDQIENQLPKKEIKFIPIDI
jgi:SNF2 family DNA or RNA helicase